MGDGMRRWKHLITCVGLVVAVHAHAQEATQSENKPPKGFTEMVVAGVVPHDEGNTVILADVPRDLFLPIGISDAAALAIHLRLEGKRFSRPLTHDLVDQIIRRLNGKLMKVQIDALNNDTFHGTLYMKVKTEVVQIDARASDALALALGSHAPIYVRDTVLKEAAIRPSDLRQWDSTGTEVKPQEEAVFSL